jgi:hypothetical protein
MVRAAYRDPDHVCERLTLFAAQRLAEPSRDWARTIRQAQPDADRLEIAHELGVRSARIARAQGVVAGTPFYVALVPGYMNYLWQEVRMTLRLATLYDRDPGTLHTAAEVLSLRGVYPSAETATAGLLAVQSRGVPPKPDRRRPLRVWIESGRRLLVFGGFLSPPSGRPRSGLRAWLRDAAGLAITAGIWAVTWVLPASFMIAMAWGCETHARQLFRRSLVHYAANDPIAQQQLEPTRWRDREHTKREIISAAGLALSVAIPVGFMAYVIHVRNTVGINWLSGLGLLVAISLVTAAAVYGSRR